MFTTARIISYLFHPMFISLGAFAILIYGNETVLPHSTLIFSICFLFSNLIPIITVLYLKSIGKISDFDASQRKQRFAPLMLGIFYSAAGFTALTILDANNLTRGLMFSYMTNTMIILGITRFWKISIHAVGVSGPVAALWVHGTRFPMVMIMIIGLVAASRVIMKAHTIPQVISGVILGLTLTYAQLHLFFV